MASTTELSLDCKSHEAAEETEKLEEFLARLQEEKLKINAFKRELPLCMQLLTNAMETSKQELQSHRMKAGARPVVEDFISLKNSTSSSSSSSSSDKANWMASATLWNQEFEGSEEKGEQLGLALEIEDGEEATRRDKSVGRKENRKTRRWWSPHLHSRFLHALHMLGGSRKATPKQITRLMKVDGLTTDEVKSHLQTPHKNPNSKPTGSRGWHMLAAHGGAAFFGPLKDMQRLHH